jgi:ATP-binding cassette subfamily B protein
MIAGGFLAATVLQGALQALLVWTLRAVLLRFSETSLTTAAVMASAVFVLGLWVLRAAMVGAAEVIAAHLAHRVEVRSMREVVAKLLTLSVRFFDRSSQGDLIMASYFDLKGIRTVTLDVGSIVLHLSRLAGLVVVAWMLSPTLAMIGLITVPLGAVPAYWIGRHLTAAAREERSAM